MQEVQREFLKYHGSYKGAIGNTKIDDSDYQCEQAHDKGDNNCSNDITCNIVSAFYGCNKNADILPDSSSLTMVPTRVMEMLTALTTRIPAMVQIMMSEDA